MIVTVISMAVCSLQSSGQSENFKHFIELRAGAGVGMFFGDLGGSLGRGKRAFWDLDLSTVRPNVSAGARINFTHWLALRGDLTIGRLVGDDSHSEDPDRLERNLSFKSDVTELAVNAEITFIDLSRWRILRNKSGALYAFAGFGVFRFNPQAEYNGEYIDLRPLGTEGQGLPGYKDYYNLYSYSLPFGVGLRRLCGRAQYIGLEITFRKSFTDYIDDVSGNYPDMELLASEKGYLATEMSYRHLNRDNDPSGRSRGNSARNDNFTFLQLTYTYGIGKKKISKARNLGLFGQKDPLRCPDF